MKAKVLWVDDRKKPYFEGQVLGEDNVRYYFNYSTATCKPKRGNTVFMEIDTETKCPCAYIYAQFNDEV